VRIISGTHKGRPIVTPSNLPVRPTTDLAKESLFNILNNSFDFEDLEVMDLFSGTGSIAFEFASRGAKRIVVVDNNYRCAEFIRKAALGFGFSNIITVQRANVFSFLKYPQAPFDLIFADPPYEMEDIKGIPDLIFKNKLLKKGGWFVLEHSRDQDFESHPYFLQHRKYGKVNFSIFLMPFEESTDKENPEDTENPADAVD
jgi:16S rRNA (guanine(966)-N(2))-methyltransferase RsmD